MIYDVPTLRDNLWFLTANKLRYCGPKNRVDVIVFVIYNFEEVLRCLINTYTVNFSSCLGEFYSSLRSEKQTYLKLTITWFEIGNRGLYSYIHWSLVRSPIRTLLSWGISVMTRIVCALRALRALSAPRSPRPPRSPWPPRSPRSAISVGTSRCSDALKFQMSSAGAYFF